MQFPDGLEQTSPSLQFLLGNAKFIHDLLRYDPRNFPFSLPFRRDSFTGGLTRNFLYLGGGSEVFTRQTMVLDVLIFTWSPSYLLIPPSRKVYLLCL